uniref:Uncharacterized protein n=1 Tax=Mycobacterium riyadhense TaxID=486698 RepID=A0A653F3Q5_9MYCO|nr:hypothetical protein BIN_B_05501 [Mycobacterium riyadhense]
MRDDQQGETAGAQQATGHDQRLVAEPVGQCAADDEHALLGEVTHPQNQSDGPGRQPERASQIICQIRHQHVEADVDAELVNHQHAAGPVEAAKLRDKRHYYVTGAGSTTLLHRVQDCTTCSVGWPMTAGSLGRASSSRPCWRQYASL